MAWIGGVKKGRAPCTLVIAKGLRVKSNWKPSASEMGAEKEGRVTVMHPPAGRGITDGRNMFVCLFFIAHGR